ncbi:MAG TPA: rhodanese-like domain-containing protein [Dermatophilaceae bacterium]|nr:rhodanese-like domain-containing protein [Dermatophilaceae bacterium]
MDRIPDGPQPGQPQVAAADLPDDALIVDVRDAADHRAGHAPGAIAIPLAELPGRLAELTALAGADPDRPLVVSCGGGSKQTRAAAYLRANGIETSVLTGGMRGWRAAGRPMVTDDSTSSTDQA